MGRKKFIINNKGQKLIIRGGTSFSFKDDTTPIRPNRIFAPDSLRTAFKEFIPDISLEQEGINYKLKVNNIADLKTLLESYNYIDKDDTRHPYTSYLETGIVFTKHSRNKGKHYSEISKGTAILWNKTTYGRELNNDKYRWNNLGLLKFKINLDDGYIYFDDYKRTSNNEWIPSNQDTKNCLILSKIYPVSSKEVDPTPVYRGQDSHEHNYYFYGLIFRLRLRNNSSRKYNKDEYALGTHSQKSIAVGFDVKTANLIISECNGYKLKNLYPSETQEE